LGDEIKAAEEQFLDKTRWGELEPVKQIAEKGLININCVDKYQRTALMIAAKRGHLQVVRYLIKKGATLDNVDPSGNSSLMYAAMSGHYDIAVALIEAGCNVALENQHGYRADTLAGKQKHTKIAEKCVAAGCYADVEDGYDEKTYWKRNIVVRSEQDEIDQQKLADIVSRLLIVNNKITGKHLSADTSSLDGLLLGLEQIARSLHKSSTQQS